MLNRYRQLRQFLLIAVMALTLAGVQLIQSSPLHNHAQHSVDCALCHLQLGDDTLARGPVAVPVAAAAVPVATLLPGFHSTSSPAPYQGRAPPRLFS